MYLCLSVETNGVGSCMMTQTLIRVALLLTDETGEIVLMESFFVQGAKQLNPEVVPWYTLRQVDNGLRREDARTHLGKRLSYVYHKGGKLVAHNLEYVLTMLTQLGLYVPTDEFGVCIMKLGTDVCKLPSVHSTSTKDYKYPKLSELAHYLLGAPLFDTCYWNTAEEKVFAVSQCYKKLIGKKSCE